MKNKIFQYMAMGVAVVGMTACNDFLDRVPQSDITPSSYFTSEADLSAYVINQYTFTSIAPGSYGISVFGYDNGTDNQAAMSASSFWQPGVWQVRVVPSRVTRPISATTSARPT